MSTWYYNEKNSLVSAEACAGESLGTTRAADEQRKARLVVGVHDFIMQFQRLHRYFVVVF